MKKLIILAMVIMTLVACGTTEEQVQAIVDKAVAESLSEYLLTPKYKSGNMNYSLEGYAESQGRSMEELDMLYNGPDYLIESWTNSTDGPTRSFNKVNWEYYHIDVQERVHNIIMENNCSRIDYEILMHHKKYFKADGNFKFSNEYEQDSIVSLYTYLKHISDIIC